MNKNLPPFTLPAVLRPEFRPCLAYYRSKAADTAKHALLTLQFSVDQGYWYPGHSRKVKAALNKTHRGVTAAVRTSIDAGPVQYRNAWIDVDFGRFERTLRYPEVATEKSEFAKWVAAFLPVAEAVALLDATRPKPVLVFKTLSPTVVENLGKVVGLDLATIEAPEITYELVEGLDTKGQKVFEWVPTVHWPEGTVHNTSKFAHGTCNNAQCHACGHAIKNSFNWVPLFGTDKDGKAHSLYVGKDCAKNLFGCEVTGEAEYRKDVA